MGLKGLTPLLDTLFLLLFTLLATSEPRAHEQLETVKVLLPEVAQSSEASQQEAPRLTLEIDQQARIRIAGQGGVLNSWEALNTALQVWLQGRSPDSISVEILGDRQAPHGVAVQLLQHLRLQGFLAIELVAHGEDRPLFPQPEAGQ
ncbi:MAG: hypothetical protein DWQ01_09595 [Planctomycetota bacterium]|nr:MAG: hypothetical protein DWQ01_09595 [Planctomycetota bacterium]